ncbi:MAG: hypothetical protein AAGB03_00700 [Pseudomonadota bacterium]
MAARTTLSMRPPAWSSPDACSVTPSRFALALADAAEQRGCRVALDPQSGQAGALDLPDGRRVFFVGTQIDLNTQAAAALARDKCWCLSVLAARGLTGPTSHLIHAPTHRDYIARTRPDLAARLPGPETAKDWAEMIGYPLIAKPNEGAAGRQVTFVSSPEALHDAVADILSTDKTALLQEFLDGREYRLLYLDGELLSAVERHRPHVKGNGSASLKTLLERYFSNNAGQNRVPDLAPNDPRIPSFLAQSGLGLTDVPKDGTHVPLLPQANLSLGATVTDATSSLPPHLIALGRKAAAALGLRLAGVDLIVPKVGAPTVLEVNAAPGFTQTSDQLAGEPPLLEMVCHKIITALTTTEQSR